MDDYVGEDHVLRLYVPVDDELGMHVVQRTADLPNKQRNPFLRQSHPSFQLVFDEVLVDVLISCVLADEVDELFIMETSV